MTIMMTTSFTDVVFVPVMKKYLYPYSASESTLCGLLCRSVVCHSSWEFQPTVLWSTRRLDQNIIYVIGIQ
jgi:hypothetical protein